MKDIKTTLNFSDGEIFETVKSDIGPSLHADMLEKVKFFLADYIIEHRLSGSLSIEVVGGGLFVDRHILPKKYAGQLDRILSDRYHARIKSH